MASRRQKVTSGRLNIDAIAEIDDIVFEIDESRPIERWESYAERVRQAARKRRRCGDANHERRRHRSIICDVFGHKPDDGQRLYLYSATAQPNKGYCLDHLRKCLTILAMLATDHEERGSRIGVVFSGIPSGMGKRYLPSGLWMTFDDFAMATGIMGLEANT